MVAVAALIMSVSAVSASFGIPVLNPLFETIVGWMISFIDRPNLTLYAIALLLVGAMITVPVALVEGMLVDRLGPRRSVFLGLILLGIGLVLGNLSQAHLATVVRGPVARRRILDERAAANDDDVEQLV